MKRLLFTIVLLICGLSIARAQQQTANSTSVSDGNVGNCYFLVGEPFGMIFEDNALRISEGTCQAHLVSHSADTSICQGTDLDFWCFHYPADTTAGNYFEQRYLHAAGTGYDSLITLRLTIHPSYHIYDTLYFAGRIIGDWQLGENIIPGTTSLGCDSNRHVWVAMRPFRCGDILYDDEDNPYHTDTIGSHCWMKENLRSLHQADGTDIPVVRVYQSIVFPDTADNADTYGYLYTWYAAVGLSEGSTDSPDTTAKGFVNGICPFGWHIPTLEEFNELNTFSSAELRSSELWLSPGNDAARFSALPAGNFNDQAQRFENLLGRTDFWTDKTENADAYAAQLRFSCETLLMLPQDKHNGFSIRCVKD